MPKKKYKVLRMFTVWQRTHVNADTPAQAAEKARAPKVRWETLRYVDDWEPVVVDTPKKPRYRKSPA